MQPDIVTDWHRLYGLSWKGAIEDESFAHPAKFARGLIGRIMEHALEEDWLHPGDTILDPFGGVALGALAATGRRLNWVGMELEERFVLMGNRNIQRWENLYRAGGYDQAGSAYLYHGDSRYLGLLLGRRVNGCVSSPPYAGGCAHTGGNDPHPEHIQGGTYHGVGIQGAISSPPYHNALKPGGKCGIDFSKLPDRAQYDSVTSLLEAQASNYGTSPAQLGAMRAGSFEAAVSSPPYNLPMSQDHSGRGGGTRGTTPSEPGAFARYGDSPGQLEGLPMGDFEACVSSPPYEGSMDHAPGNKNWKEEPTEAQARQGNKGYSGNILKQADYGASFGQMGTERGETFWPASRQVIEQVHQVLAPGAHAIWVCKDFVRKGERVPFTHRWAELCVSCGFEWLHEHRAWVVENYGTQLGFFEDKQIVKKRMSFFRRLAEKNGAPPIHWESVLCFQKRELEAAV